MVGETLVPPWLEPLLGTPFFSPCATHGDAAHGECNMFCLDCPDFAGFCFYCRTASHAGHRVIQIRRSSYHDVVRVSEVQRALDIRGVQTYVINSARVVFLNERPQPKATASSSLSGASKSAAHACEICRRALLDPFHFCSLGCKLEGIKKMGGACFVLRASKGDDEEAGEEEPATSTRGTGTAADRKTVTDGASPERAGPAWREEGEGLHGGAGHHMCPPTPSINARRRKGIPRRAPIAS